MSTTGKYDHLSPYELKRLERIRKNAEHLKKLGLGDKYHNFMRKKSPPKKRKSCPLPRVKPGEERRSGRIASKVDFVANDEKVVRQDGRNDYDFDYDDDYDDNVVDVICYRKSRRKRIEGDEWKLSEVDRKSLLGKVDDKYLGKFQEFLEYHDCISPQNVRNVMRQARKLASGEGIRYEVRMNSIFTIIYIILVVCIKLLISNLPPNFFNLINSSRDHFWFSHEQISLLVTVGPRVVISKRA